MKGDLRMRDIIGDEEILNCLNKCFIRPANQFYRHFYDPPLSSPLGVLLSPYGFPRGERFSLSLRPSKRCGETKIFFLMKILEREFALRHSDEREREAQEMKTKKMAINVKRSIYLQD